MVCSGIGWNLLRLSFGKNIQTFFGSSAQSHSKIRILKGGNFSNGVPGIQLVCNPDRCVSGREIPCQLSLRMELKVKTSQNATILVDNYSNIFEEDLRFV